MISHHAALIYTMVLVSAADARMTDEELQTIGDIVKHLPVFRDYDPELLVTTAESCAEMLDQDEGLEAVVGLIKQSLTPPLRETAYALACEIAAVDGKADQEELEMLVILRQSLDIDRLIAAGIERGIRACHQRAE